MEISLQFNAQNHSSTDLIILGTFSKTQTTTKKVGRKTTEEKTTTPVLTSWPKEFKDAFNALNSKDQFSGSEGSTFSFDVEGVRVLAYGLGDKKNYNDEKLRVATAKAFGLSKTKVPSVSFDLDSFMVKTNGERTAKVMGETLVMTSYEFRKYLKAPSSLKVEKVFLDTKMKGAQTKKVSSGLEEGMTVGEAVCKCRDFVNEPPNILHSESYAQMVKEDIKGTKGVKVKVLGKAELEKQGMGMFLSVNAGSAYEPQLVHLTYTPTKVTKNTKHIVLVGKGLTFDTGGYSLKPASVINNMKFDMAGSATVYGAFRAAAKAGLPVKVTCLLGMTDNAVNEHATMPDSIVTAKNGKTVEILNTDAEGRLVLGDVLSYGCELEPDAIINAATLTGACLVALGTEVCGLMGNDKKLIESLKKAAESTDEYIWQLPIVKEWREDMKSNIADLKNIGSSRFAGTAKAGAFLEEFVTEGTPWAHLDIAGVGDSQSHLPYCPKKGGSGLMVRTLFEYLKS